MNFGGNPFGQGQPQGYPNQYGGGYPGQQQNPFGNQNFGGYTNWQSPQGYHFNPIPLDKNYIKSNADAIFAKYDHDRSNSLNMNEAAYAIYEMYSTTGQTVSQNDIMYAFNTFDKNRDGHLNKKEFKSLVKKMSGNKKQHGKHGGGHGGHGGRSSSSSSSSSSGSNGGHGKKHKNKGGHGQFPGHGGYQQGPPGFPGQGGYQQGPPGFPGQGGYHH